MTDQHQKYLLDIAEAIRHIQLFTEEIHSYPDYAANLLVRRAVEREVEIIGEAMS